MCGSGNGMVKIFHGECSKNFFRLQNATQFDGEGDVGPEEAVSTREWAEQKHCSCSSGTSHNRLVRASSEACVFRNENNRVSNTSAST